MMTLLFTFLQVVLTWDPPQNNTPAPQGWNVYQDGIKVATVATRRYENNITFGAAPVCWKVTAYNSVGESGFSNEACLGKPSTPAALSAQLPG
jgi:hypothetical protein